MATKKARLGIGQAINSLQKKANVEMEPEKNMDQEIQKLADDSPLQERVQGTKMDKMVPVSFTLKQSALEKIDAYCERNGLTRSSYFRMVAIRGAEGDN